MTATLTEAPPAPSTTGAPTAGQELPGEFRMLPLAEIHESPENPRTHYDPVALQQLAENFKAVGQITAVIVRPRVVGTVERGVIAGRWAVKNSKGATVATLDTREAAEAERRRRLGVDGYELAAGHRRFRAAKLAGLPTLKAEIRELDDAQFVEILNVENLQRDDLNALEEAEGFAQLMKVAGYDVPKIAERVGRSEKYVYDRLKLRALIPAAKKLLLANVITPGHGILLARLTKEDQERALDLDGGHGYGYGRDGGLLEREDVSDEYTLFRQTPEDQAQAAAAAKALGRPDEPGEDTQHVKARSVRELAQWIDRNVRFNPAEVNQADLAFDLPATAEILAARANDKLKVVKITREYRVPDAARDEKERTYGTNGWKRADGQPELVNQYGEEKDPKPSLTCEWSRVGLIVAGPGRGEAFLVCVNKDKCDVHWSAERKERERRAKARAREASSNGGAAAPAKAPKVDPTVLPAELRETWTGEEITAQVPTVVKAIKALIGELKISDEICWNLVGSDLYLESWNKVGKREWTNTGFEEFEEFEDQLAPLVAVQLPGRFAGKSVQAQDGPGARAELAWRIWLVRDSGAVAEGIEKAVHARWASELKARAKSAPVQTSGKAKKRAGDVARAKRAKKKAAAGRTR
jgi:ParB/RepB/Spo0J family partition protein